MSAMNAPKNAVCAFCAGRLANTKQGMVATVEVLDPKRGLFRKTVTSCGRPFCMQRLGILLFALPGDMELLTDTPDLGNKTSNDNATDTTSKGKRS